MSDACFAWLHETARSGRASHGLAARAREPFSPGASACLEALIRKMAGGHVSGEHVAGERPLA
jgi:hypothetical protein